MKKASPIFFFIAMGVFVIGIHQAIVHGISHSYWLFMLSLALLFINGYFKNKPGNDEQKSPPKSEQGNKKKKSKPTK
jgi:hypothetical protein